MREKLSNEEKIEMSNKDAMHGVLKVMGEVSYQKKTTVQGLRYSFAAIEDLVGQLRPAMVDAHIALRKTEVLSYSMEVFENSNGNRVCCSTVHCRYTFGRLDLGDGAVTVSYEGIGYAQDTSDKAPAKAMTAALKVALRQGFLIEIGDSDPDKVRIEHVKKGRAGVEDTLEAVIDAIRGAKTMARLDGLERAAADRPKLQDAMSQEMIEIEILASRKELEAKSSNEPEPAAKSLRG